MIKTLLLTDIVNSTALTEELGDDRMSNIWIEHDRIARDLLEKHHGKEADRTDGFLMLFDDPSDACHYAQELHQAFESLSSNESIDFKSRIGIHTGEIILIETSAEQRVKGAKPLEVEGIAKPTAARTMSIARGGQTLLSNEAFDALDDHVIKSISHGHWRMKGVAEPMELIEVGDETTNFHPPKDGEKVYRVNLNEGVWVPVKETKNNLTPERDSFIGRKEDLHRLGTLNNKEHIRLVTLRGPGGTGKTRLSKRFGRMWLGDYPGGIWFCDLAEAVTLEGIANAVAIAMDVPLLIDDPVEQLGNSLEGRGSCLVILDNFEQVTQFAEATVGRWMNMAADAKFIVTSRNRLHLDGEKTIRLQPLAVDKDGVHLFETRARERGNDFQITEDNREDIHAIVENLDGMPLAIELAAARIGMMQPRQIRERLSDRFKLLGGVKGPTKRQQTLRTTIDWSWDLLEEWEKSALAQCSAFEGGFTLDAAEAVIDLSPFEQAPMSFDVVQALIDKSLIKTDVKRYDISEPWYGLYVSIAEYSAEKLRTDHSFEGSGEPGQKECWQRHIAFYAQFGKEDYIDLLATQDGLAKSKALKDELDNLMTACNRAILYKDGNNAALLLCAAWEVVKGIGPFIIIKAPAEILIKMQPMDEIAGLRVYYILSSYYGVLNDPDQIHKTVDQALTISSSINDLKSEGIFKSLKFRACIQSGQIELGTAHFEESLEIARQVGDAKTEIEVLSTMGALLVMQGKMEEGKAMQQKGLELSKQIGNVLLEGRVLERFAVIYNNSGEAELAKQSIERLFDIALASGNQKAEATALFYMSYALMITGEYKEAQNCIEKCLLIAREMGNKLEEAHALTQLASYFSKQGNDLAKAYLESAISMFKGMKTGIWGACRAYNNLGAHYTGVKAYSLAEHSYLSALDLSTKLGMASVEGASRNGLGNISTLKGKYEEALNYLTEAMEIWEQTDWPAGAGYTYRSLGNLHAKKGEYEKAYEYYEQGKTKLKDRNDYLLTELLLDFSEAAIEHGDRDLAKENFDGAIDLVSGMQLGAEALIRKEVGRVQGLVDGVS